MVRISYNKGDEILEIIVRDSSGAKIETLRCNMSDHKSYGKIIKGLKDKYGAIPQLTKDLLDLDNDFIQF